MGACIRQWYPEAQVTSLDYVESHLTGLVGAASGRATPSGCRFARRASTTSFVRSFCIISQDDQVVELLRNFGEVARKAVLVIDLERNPIPYYFIAWSRPILGWDPVTVHDGAISVEAAFRRKELEDLARQAGLRNPRARVFRPAFRIALVAAGSLTCAPICNRRYARVTNPRAGCNPAPLSLTFAVRPWPAGPTPAVNRRR